MAPLLLKPRSEISSRAIPLPIQTAINHIFKNGGAGVMLVGGTALAGYYAEHRRSDDIDLFVKDESAYQMTHRSVESLKKLGAVFSHSSHSPYYYHSDVSFLGHPFTVDIVLDENLFRIGKGLKTKEGVIVADAETLFAMKAACLVSRCSEKDLFDLDWFFGQKGGIDIAEILKKGEQVDSGLTLQTLLISLKGTTLREEACGFSLNPSPQNQKEIYEKIVGLQKKLISLLLDYEKKSPLPTDILTLKQSVKNSKDF